MRKGLLRQSRCGQVVVRNRNSVFRFHTNLRRLPVDDAGVLCRQRQKDALAQYFSFGYLRSAVCVCRGLSAEYKRKSFCAADAYVSAGD